MPYCIVAFLAFFLLQPVAYADTDPCAQQHCMIVIDAGSSGSRAHFYTYEEDETHSPEQINEIWSNRITPGLSSIEINQTAINNYMDNLLSTAPPAKAPVFFYSTAGMRLLPLSRQTKYYEAIAQWFSQHQQWQLTDAKTISGTEEALYDWLAINYRLGALQSGEKKSVGVMDMGGASVQIAFPVQENTGLQKESQITFDLYGQHITLFVYSFLGLGQTEVMHQFLDSVACFANNYPLPDGDTGHGNAFICEQEIASLTNGVHKVSELIQPLLAQNPVDSWYSLGGISHLADSEVFSFDNNQLTNQSLLQQAQQYACDPQWSDLSKHYPGDDNVYQYCLLAAYYYALMVDGYNLYPQQTVHYIPAKQYVDWTLGVVLFKR